MRSDLIVEIEYDYSWRIAEIIEVNNIISLSDKEERKRVIRKSNVVMMYSHYEGFAKSSFEQLIRAINESRVRSKDAKLSIAAASMYEVFRDLRDPSRRSKYFKKHDLDNDTDKLAREMEFLDNFHYWSLKEVKLSDDIIDPNSNLTPNRLKQIMFRLGVPWSEFEGLIIEINNLISLRNRIAHGSYKEGLNENTYDRCMRIFQRLMLSIRGFSIDLLKKEFYLDSKFDWVVEQRNDYS